MNHFISLDTAKEMTKRYRDNNESILENASKGQNILPLCETFDRSAFDTLLAKTGCTAIRLYYGMDVDLKIHAIVVAVNGNDEDMLLSSSSSSSIDVEDIVEESRRCPDSCPPPSDLNS